ncbi:pentapeptide repeat-containing protein [Streptomyces sp. NPDC050534]
MGDFTEADLRDADLAGMDLTGVAWCRPGSGLR